MIAEQIPAVSHLSIEEKWLLANELIDEVDEHQGELTTRSEIIEIVQKRFEEFEHDPSTAMTLETFKLRFSLP